MLPGRDRDWFRDRQTGKQNNKGSDSTGSRRRKFWSLAPRSAEHLYYLETDSVADLFCLLLLFLLLLQSPLLRPQLLWLDGVHVHLHYFTSSTRDFSFFLRNSLLTSSCISHRFAHLHYFASSSLHNGVGEGVESLRIIFAAILGDMPEDMCALSNYHYIVITTKMIFLSFIVVIVVVSILSWGSWESQDLKIMFKCWFLSSKGVVYDQVRLLWRACLPAHAVVPALVLAPLFLDSCCCVLYRSRDVASVIRRNPIRSILSLYFRGRCSKLEQRILPETWRRSLIFVLSQ